MGHRATHMRPSGRTRTTTNLLMWTLAIGVFLSPACGSKKSATDGNTDIVITADDGSATLTITEGSLPDGVSASDISIVRDDSRVSAVDGTAMLWELSPEGLVFSSPARMQMVVDFPEGQPLLVHHHVGLEVEGVEPDLSATTFADGNVSSIGISIEHFSDIVVLSSTKSIGGLSGGWEPGATDTPAGQKTRPTLRFTGPDSSFFFESTYNSKTGETLELRISAETTDLWNPQVYYTEIDNLTPALLVPYSSGRSAGATSEVEHDFTCGNVGAYKIGTESYIEFYGTMTTTNLDTGRVTTETRSFEVGWKLDTGAMCTAAIPSDIDAGTPLGWASPSALTITLNGTVLVLDQNLDALTEVDPVTKEISLVSDAVTGSGPALDTPTAVAGLTGQALGQFQGGSAALLTSGTVLVADSALAALMVIDVANGNRSILSDSATGTGPALAFPVDLAVDLPNNRALVADNPFSGPRAIVSVDLTTGNRTIMSDATTGTGAPLSAAKGVAYDSANNRVLVFSNASLLAVDLATGNRTVVSNNVTGTGTNFSVPESQALDSANSRVVVTDSGIDAVFLVDLTTGNRTVLSDASTGTGPAFVSPKGVALDLANGIALALDSVLDAVVAVDLATGNRTIFAE